MPQATFSSRIAYKDLESAIEWLEKAFAFMRTTLSTSADGKVVYAEMRFGSGVIQIGSEWENIKAPSSIAGANTRTITVHLEDGIDQHCERARAAGGSISLGLTTTMSTAVHATLAKRLVGTGWDSLHLRNSMSISLASFEQSPFDGTNSLQNGTMHLWQCLENSPTPLHLHLNHSVSRRPESTRPQAQATAIL